MKFLVPFMVLLVVASGATSSRKKQGKSDGPYWAYQLVSKVPVPDLKDPFVTNPIDAFILEGLRERKISPNNRATASELQRRLSYDLIGLPPGEGDPSADSEWSMLVDHYLASPQFGEKFATHWLDLVRYAETNGFERDSQKPEIWRYRDYVIRSFNEDKPYDQFVREQLAGDQLSERTLATSIATGFLTLMQRDDEPADKIQAHADVISDMMDVTAEAIMGTTMACAKCHDHKGDPVTQADYFSMRSFFGGIRKDLFKQANHTWVDAEVTREREQKAGANRKAIADLWQSVDLSHLSPYLKKADDPQSVNTNWHYRVGMPSEPTWSLPSFDAKADGFIKELKGSRNKPIILRSEFGLQKLPENLLVYLRGDLKKLEIFINGSRVHEGVTEKIHDRYFIPLPTKDLTTGKNVIGIVTRTPHPKMEVEMTRAPLHDVSADQLALLHPQLISQKYGAEFGEQMKPLQIARREFLRPIAGVRYMGVHEVNEVEPARIHKRGNAHVPGNEVPVAFPDVLDHQNLTPERTRLELANWLTSPEHPLVARVWVNRLWQYCFGRGLVESANDFGVLGTGVTNQKLLDWLANELISSGWSTKHVLRLMLNSSTYRLSSNGVNDSDPTNLYHWKHSPRRLTAEEIWDTYQVLTGQLDLKMGGPPIRPEMPREILQTSSTPGRVWPASPENEAHRRAVYIHVKRSIKLPLLANYDSPERDLSCPTRFATTVPTQALTNLNSERMNRFSERFATRLEGSLEEKIKQAFRLATSREINDDELQQLGDLAADLRDEHKVPEGQIMPRLCLLILNLNETIYLD